MKHIAKTLTGVFNTPDMIAIMDRGSQPDYDTILASWKPDLFARKPAPALNWEGEYKGTDLDLATFLMALADRGAIIKIPQYKSMRESTIKEGQALSSKENRHGKIIGLVANQDLFSFGLKMIDHNVWSTDSVGDFRNFNVIDFDGTWYDGWHSIEFMPNAKENDFIQQYAISVGGTITFSNFVHPTRRYGVFSQSYFIAKAAIQRIDEEAKYLAQVIADMLASGLKYPATGNEKPKEWPKSTTIKDGKSVKIDAHKFELDLGGFKNEYPAIGFTVDNLVAITKRRKWLVNTIKPQLTFVTRTTEYAYIKYAPKDLPHWIKNAKWETGYIEPPSKAINSAFIKKFKDADQMGAAALMGFVKDRSFTDETSLKNALTYYSVIYEHEVPDFVFKTAKKKTEWDRLVLFQEQVGKRGIAIRKRTYQKSEKVSKDYQPKS